MREELRSEGRIEMEKTVIQALERKPEIAVPEDFAARVARSMPAELPARAEARPMFGQAAGYLAVAVLAIALLVLTWKYPEALEAGRGFLFAVELLLVAQLLAVGFWLGIKNNTSQ